MLKNSKFRPAFERREQRLHTGFDYKGKIMKKSLSSQMFGVNETLSTFISKLDSAFYECVEAVKQIKIFANPAVDKYEKNIN